jgi:hypothetical protein
VEGRGQLRGTLSNHFADWKYFEPASDAIEKNLMRDDWLNSTETNRVCYFIDCHDGDT